MCFQGLVELICLKLPCSAGFQKGLPWGRTNSEYCPFIVSIQPQAPILIIGGEAEFCAQPRGFGISSGPTRTRASSLKLLGSTSTTSFLALEKLCAELQGNSKNMHESSQPQAKLEPQDVGFPKNPTPGMEMNTHKMPKASRDSKW